MEQESQEIEQKEKKGNPLRVILALALAILIILTAVPYYNVRLDPSPSYVPSIKEVLPTEYELRNSSAISSAYDLKFFVTPHDPNVKYMANRIATLSCDGNQICQSKAMYYFVRDNLEYVADPINSEYIEPNIEMVSSGGGDCESGSLVLASLQEAIGVDAQLVFVYGHAYVRIKLDDAPRKYKHDDWIYLDWTCKECAFGEIPWQNWEKHHNYLEVP